MSSTSDLTSAGAPITPGLVSVIVAAYNAAEYLEATCRSALSQTYAPLEVIVVDDGSTDGTAAIVERLASADPRVKLIRQRNLGVAAARNAAIAAARGEFIAPLDADDLWESRKVERQVQRLRECGPEAAMAYCWWVWIDERDRFLDRSPGWSIEGRVLDQLVEVNFTGNASVPLFRRTCLDEVGGYSVDLRRRNSQGCEDWDLAIKVAERYDVAVVPAVLVGYRRRSDGMSTACDTMWRSHARVLEALLERQPGMSRRAVQQSRGQFALHLAGVAFWSRRYGEAIRWGLRARPFTHTLRIAPHVMRAMGRRMLGRLAEAPAGSSRLFEDSALAAPLIPYDNIYGRRWRRQT
jgi:glycosyltransferase involved in cell wall biosynthesis